MTDPAAQMDVRLHSPAPGTVIVWVCGRVGHDTVDALSAHVHRQFDRATDVVLDLGHADLEPAAVDALRRLRKEAAEGDVALHLAADGPCRAVLLESGARAGQIHPSAAAAIACIPPLDLSRSSITSV